MIGVDGGHSHAVHLNLLVDWHDAHASIHECVPEFEGHEFCGYFGTEDGPLVESIREARVVVRVPMAARWWVRSDGISREQLMTYNNQFATWSSHTRAPAANNSFRPHLRKNRHGGLPADCSSLAVARGLSFVLKASTVNRVPGIQLLSGTGSGDDMSVVVVSS